MSFHGEPGNKPPAELGKALDDSPGHAKLPCGAYLGLLFNIVEGVKEENGLLEMAYNRQERIGQNGKCFPRAGW